MATTASICRHVVLDHVAKRPGLLVVGAAILDADRLGHRELDVVDITPVPDRLEDRVGEPEDQHVLDGFLPEVVVDPVDLGFVERAVGDRVELARRLQVAAERLLDHDARGAGPARQTGLSEPANDVGEEAWLRRKVEDAVAGNPAFGFDLLEVAGQILIRGRRREVAAQV